MTSGDYLSQRKSTFFLYSFWSYFYSYFKSFVGFSVFLHICEDFVLKFKEKFIYIQYFCENYY